MASTTEEIIREIRGTSDRIIELLVPNILQRMALPKEEVKEWKNRAKS